MPKTRSGKKTTRPSPERTKTRRKRIQEESSEDDDDDRVETPLATQKPSPVAEEEEEEEEDEASEEEENEKKPPAANDDDDDDESQTSVDSDEEAEEEHRLADKHIFDIMDYQQEIIFDCREKRKKYFQVHKYFWQKHYEYTDKRFGRLYSRYLMTRILMDACTFPAYTKTVGLVNWSAPAWGELLKLLAATRSACIRSDCVVAEMRDDTVPDKTPGQHAQHKAFSARYMNCVGLIQIHEALAPIRRSLEDQIGKRQSGKPKINAKMVDKVFNAIQKNKTEKVRYFLFQLFERADGEEDEPDMEEEEVARRPVLKDLEDLEEILKEKPFVLHFIQDKLESLIQTWVTLCFGMKEPELFRVQYDDAKKIGKLQTPRSKAKAVARGTPIRSPSHGLKKRPPEVSSLERHNAELNDPEKHGKDPLEDSRQIAEEATGKPRAQLPSSSKSKKKKKRSAVEDVEETPKKKKRSGGLYEKKKTGCALTFSSESSSSSSDDDDDSDDGPKRARLPKVPKKRKSIQIRFMKDHPPDEGRFDAAGHVLQRVPFDEDEDNAIRAGLQKFGVGKWQKIKNEHGHILRNRTNIMIKDRYRNMLRLGLVDPSPPTEEEDDDDNDDNGANDEEEKEEEGAAARNENNDDDNMSNVSNEL